MPKCDQCGKTVNVSHAVKIWDSNFAPKSKEKSAYLCKDCVKKLDI